MIDLVTFMRMIDLQSDLTKAFLLAGEASLPSKGSQTELLRHVQYHVHMTKMGTLLWKTNDDLPERDWKALLNFDGLMILISFSGKVLAVLSEACASHWPFMSTFELETTDFPMIN